LLFQKGGPKPWKAKPGNSLLDQRIHEVEEKAGKEGMVVGGVEGMNVESLEFGGKAGVWRGAGP